ncbi:hypothetical protein [Parasediminibacterium sp. JCM 36343]|uniref:hypothetical protein n=1 Tax=Parasediminibacterium sp. JCM 36343 TaxID=3374279 RepID=UPI00397D90AE
MFGQEFENLPFGQWKILQEIKIRGRFLSLSADLEYYIIKIIVYCDAKNPEIVRKFKRCLLGMKLKWLKEDFEKHFPEKYKLLSVTLDLLETKLLTIRNHIAHCQIFFDENEQDRSFIEILDIQFIDGENKFERVIYQIDELQTAVEEFKKINTDLLQVWKDLVDDYNLDNPNSLITT